MSQSRRNIHNPADIGLIAGYPSKDILLPHPPDSGSLVKNSFLRSQLHDLVPVMLTDSICLIILSS